MPKINDCPTVVSLNPPEVRKLAEIESAITVAAHAQLLVADHFSDLLKSNVCTNPECKNDLEGFCVHRTKCTKNLKM